MGNASPNKRTRKKSKFLLRRILIVMALLLSLFMIIKFSIFMFNLIFKNEQKDEFEPDTGYVITSEHDTSNEETSSTGNTEIISTTTAVTSTSTSEVTGTTTTEGEIQTTIETTEMETIGEDKSMNFKEVAYYIEQFENRYQSYFKRNPDLTNQEIVRNVNMNLDFPFYENIQTSPDLNSVQVLCNKYFALPSDYSPDNLVDVPSDYYVNDGKEYILNEEALNAFIQMSDTAKVKGLSLRIISAYRSNSYQERLYGKYKEKNGQADADRYSARPGHSEHETGYGIDINDVSQAFENTDEFDWLQENAHLFGFILRYPKGLNYQTGYIYEPWHYRYLGIDLATKVKESGLTYDAYYAMYLMN